MLIIGGNAHGFAAANEAYIQASKAGIGVARMLLPDSLHKLLGRGFAAGEFAPSTPSGSFSQRALAEALAMANWADGVLIAGDLGRNSETAILLEKFISKYTGQLTITKDAADYCLTSPAGCIDRPDTTLVISMAQLQKLGIQSKFRPAFMFDMDIIRLVAALHEFTIQHPVNIVVKHFDTIFVAVEGKVSSTKRPVDETIWRVKTAASASTWWIQNPSKIYEALTTSALAD